MTDEEKNNLMADLIHIQASLRASKDVYVRNIIEESDDGLTRMRAERIGNCLETCADNVGRHLDKIYHRWA